MTLVIVVNTILGNYRILFLNISIMYIHRFASFTTLYFDRILLFALEIPINYIFTNSRNSLMPGTGRKNGEEVGHIHARIYCVKKIFYIYVVEHTRVQQLVISRS